MTKKGHQLFGFTTALVIGLPVIPALIGSTLPDLDLYFRNRKGGLLFSHRGITHHVILGIILTASVFYVRNYWFTSFVAGYISHLIADFLTPSGIPYWSNKDRMSLNIFKTGSLGEIWFLIALTISLIAFIGYEKGVYGLIPFEIKYLFLKLEVTGNISN